MKRLLSYLRPYRRECVLGPLFKLLEAALELLVPLVVAAVIDTGVAQGDRGFALRMCLLLAALGAVGLTFSVIAQYFAAKAATGFAARLRQALYAHIHTFSYATLDAAESSTLITRLTGDMNQVQSGVNLTLRLLLRSPFVVFGAMIMAFTLDVRSALVFAAVIPVLGAAVFGIMLPGIPLYRRVQERLDRVLSRVRENLTGVRVIRAFCREETETAAFSENNEWLTAAQNRAGRVSALLNPLTYVLINFALLVLLWTGAVRVNGGTLTAGVVVALYNYMSQILVELIKLANLIITITRSVACGRRIADVLDIPAVPETAAEIFPVAGAPRVELRDVTLRYHPDAAPALEHISFTLAPGEVLGVIGGTSAGKSSLLHLIPRFYDATDGQVLVDGVDVARYPAGELRRKIGVVPQKAVLFRGTLRDNLRMAAPDATDEEIWAALDAAQARSVAEESPEGLGRMIEQDGRNLSGGQRQRVTIARALVRRPEILLLDDAAAALDYGTEAALRRALRHLPWSPTIVTVSQRISAVRDADRIAVLEDGLLAGLDTYDRLLKTCPVFREIAASQDMDTDEFAVLPDQKEANVDG